MFDSTPSTHSGLRHLRPNVLISVCTVLALSAFGCATAGNGGGGDPDAAAKDPGPSPDAAPGVSPYGVDLYLRGTFNDFGLTAPMTYHGQNLFSAELALSAGAHEFKIADADFSDDTTFALNTAQEGAVALDTPTPLLNAIGLDNNVLLFVPQTGTYRFELSAANRTSPALLVSLIEPAPYNTSLYLRGSFNEFDTSIELEYVGQRRYRATTTLTVGSYQLKIADAAYNEGTTFSVNAGTATAISLDVPALLVSAPGENNNTLFDVAQTGVFEFTLVANNPITPSLLITQPDIAPYAEALYLQADFDPEGAPSVEMRYVGDGRYVGVLVADAGTIGFKIADAALSDGRTFSIDPVQGTTMEVDQPAIMIPTPADGSDTTVEIVQPATYEFDFNAKIPEAPVLTVRIGTPAPYAASMFLQGSFNGFGATDRLTYVGGTTYELVIALDADTHRFKVADADFSDQATFSVDAAGPKAIQLDIPTKLEPATGENNNTEFTVASAGVFRFTLTAETPAAPILLIELEPAPAQQ